MFMKVVLPVPFRPIMMFTSSLNLAVAVLDCQKPETSMELTLNMVGPVSVGFLGVRNEVRFSHR